MACLPERACGVALVAAQHLSYREIQVAPYRVIYQVNTAAREVSIHVVADGRRNFTELLRERLLMPPVAG